MTKKIMSVILLGLMCMLSATVCFGAAFISDAETEASEETLQRLNDMEGIFIAIANTEISSGDMQEFDHTIENEGMFPEKFWSVVEWYAAGWNPWMLRDGFTDNPHYEATDGIGNEGRSVLFESELMDLGRALYEDFSGIPEVPFEESIPPERQAVIQDGDRFLFRTGEWGESQIWADQIRTHEDGSVRMKVYSGFKESHDIWSTHFIDLVPNTQVNEESDFPYYYTVKKVVYYKGDAQDVSEESPDETDPDSGNEDTSGAEVSKEAVYADYARLVGEYQEAKTLRDENRETDIASMYGDDVEWSYYFDAGRGILFSLIDLNDDGLEELFISTETGKGIALLDIFIARNGKAERIIDDLTYGNDRIYVELCENHVLAAYDNAGGSSYGVDTYVMNGTDAVKTQALWHNNDGCTVSDTENTETISEEEFENLYNSIVKVPMQTYPVSEENLEKMKSGDVGSLSGGQEFEQHVW